VKCFAAVLAGALLVALTAAGAGALPARDEVGNRRYARQVCAEFSDVRDAENELVAAYLEVEKTDPVHVRREAIDLTGSYLDALRAAQKTLADVYPEGGKRVARPFSRSLQQAVSAVTTALEDLENADPDDEIALAAEVATFEAALVTLGSTVKDPFSDVADLGLLGAFRDEPRCADVVTVSEVAAT
jgi:hypothetical protein